MFKFIRENSGIIVKFIITHVVMSVLGIMVGLAVLVAGGESTEITSIAIIGGLFTIGFMCFMHYDEMYFYSVKEGIRIRAEGGVPDRFKGLKIVLLAYLPVIIVGLVAIVTDIVAHDVENVSAITMLIYYAVQGSFLPIATLRVAIGVTGYVIITLIPAIIFGVLGYAIGFKDKTLRGIFGINAKPPFDGPLERKLKNNDKDK